MPPFSPLVHSCSEFLFLGRVYQFVAMPLGLATSLLGFTSLVKEVRKLALGLGISVHMLQHNWLIRANSCQRLILQLFLRVGSWGDSLLEVMYLLLQQVSFLGQVFNLSKAIPHRGKGGHGGRVVTLSPPTSEARDRSLYGLKWESW